MTSKNARLKAISFKPTSKVHYSKQQFLKSGIRLLGIKTLGGGMGRIERQTHTINSKGEKILNGHTWSKTKNGKGWVNWSTLYKDEVKIQCWLGRLKGDHSVLNKY